MNRSIVWLGVTGAVAAIACCSAIIAEGANKYYVGPGSGVSANWNSAANWSATSGGAGGAGVPASGNAVNITNSDGVSRTVKYDYSGSPVTLDDFLVDLTGGAANATNTLSMSANNLTVSTEEAVGFYGSGTFNQTGGSNSITAGFLGLGIVSGSTGTYTLSNSGSLTASGEEIIGDSGTGIFVQSGGTNTINNSALEIGLNAGSTGNYSLTGGTLSAPTVYVGGSASGSGGTGVLTVSGTGVLNVLGSMLVSSNNNEIDLKGGTITVSTEEAVGFYGSGTFNQTGGSNSITAGFLGLGIVSGSTGTYTLSNSGSLTASGEEIIGDSGTGIFVQSGGTNTINNSALEIGLNAGSTGNYSLTGGTLSAPNVYVGGQNSGAGGAGVLTVSGTGVLNVPGSLFVYNTPGTALNLMPGGTINAGGSFLLAGGFNWTGGTFNITDSTVEIDSRFGDFPGNSLTLASGMALACPFEVVGGGGTGSITQTGGTNTITTYRLEIGDAVGSSGNYSLAGGTLSAPNVYVGGQNSGAGGAGVLTVSGTGSATVTGTLKVWNTAGTALNLSGGTINTGSLDLSGNPALLNWTGGTLNITNKSVTIDDSASAWNGFSSLTLNSGMALEVSLPETIGGGGTGALTLAGGRNSVGFGLSVGFGVGSHGTYTISGNGLLTTFSGETIGGNGTGILNQSGGQNYVFSGSLSLGVTSGSVGTYTLSGGSLTASDIYVGGSSAGPGGAGVLTVSGSGSFNSSTSITVYNTPGSGFNVNGGAASATALNLIGTYTQTAGSATYGHITGGGQMNISGGQVILTDDSSGHLASVNVSGTTTLGFDIGTSNNSQITADTATFNAAPTIAFTLSGYPEGGTVFTLLSATHFNDNGNLSSLPSQAVTIGRDILTPSLTGGSGAAGAIIVTMTGGPANLTWIGNNNVGFDGGGAWDTQTTNNWENHSNEALTPDVFYAGDHVTFDDTAANFVVDLNSGDVVANSVTFNNSLNAYTVNGFNSIAGSTNVTFAGSNSVTLNNYNRYTGTTTISGGGTVSIGGSNASPTINVTNGTLQLAADYALTGTPVVTLGNGTTTGVLDLDGTNTNAVGGLSGGAGNLVTNTNAAPATLIFATGTSTFGGAIQDGISGGPVALNISSGSLTLSGTNTYSGGTMVNGGTLVVNGSILGDVAVNFGATLAGHGSVGGMMSVSYGGLLSPGTGPTSTGALTLGSLTLYSGAQTNIKLAGITPGSQYDQVQVMGPLSLDGILQVSLINGFTPAVGNTFDILTWPNGGLTGTFATLQLPALSGAEAWDTSQLYTTGALTVTASYLPGDINRDGQVTVADIAALMVALSDLNAYKAANSDLMSDPQLLLQVADVNGDGKIDNTDVQALITLVANNTVSGGGALTAVPEPSTLILSAIGLSVLALGRLRRPPAR